MKNYIGVFCVVLSSLYVSSCQSDTNKSSIATDDMAISPICEFEFCSELEQIDILVTVFDSHPGRKHSDNIYMNVVKEWKGNVAAEYPDKPSITVNYMNGVGFYYFPPDFGKRVAIRVYFTVRNEVVIITINAVSPKMSYVTSYACNYALGENLEKCLYEKVKSGFSMVFQGYLHNHSLFRVSEEDK